MSARQVNWNPLFVSFATADSGYVREIDNLLQSLRALSLDFDYEIIDSRGSWQANNAFRPAWIRKQLDIHQRPVVWLDADAIVRERPEAFWEEGYDFMAYFRPGGRISAGTLYWAPTETAFKLLKEWELRASAPFSEWPDEYLLLTEWHLRDAFQAVGDVKVKQLCESYLAIFDAPPDNPPVIEHFQASRRFKAQVGDLRTSRENTPEQT